MRKLLLVAALLPGCSAPYLVETRHLERAREALAQRVPVALPAEREESGRRVHLDARAVYDRQTQVDRKLALIADPAYPPEEILDGRVRVRAQPHPITRAGIADLLAGLALAAIGGITWATVDTRDVWLAGLYGIEPRAAMQSLVGLGAGGVVTGAILWTVGEVKRPYEVGPARARYTYVDELLSARQ